MSMHSTPTYLAQPPGPTTIVPASFTPVPARQVQRACACGGTPGPDGECAACRQKRLMQRSPADSEERHAVPPSVHAALQSPGQPLDPATRRVMEARFGHDFSQVRIHADQQAADSASAVHARAYTVGHDVVFGARQFAPTTTEGKRLLTHELAHVIQQRGASASGAIQLGAIDTAQEREADAFSRSSEPAPGAPAASITPGQVASVQRQPSPTAQLNLTIDERGRVDLTLAGPDLPVVSQPSIGIRRQPDGSYDLLVGGKGKTVAASEIPQLLRGALGGGGKPGSKPAPQQFRVPRCDQLRAASGTRYMTFDEYRISQLIAPDLLPLTPSLYEALLEICKPKPIEIPEQPKPELQDAPTRTLPEGMEYA